jgi:hypothetical protein
MKNKMAIVSINLNADFMIFRTITIAKKDRAITMKSKGCASFKTSLIIKVYNPL